MRVLGLDPGVTRTGYALVERAGARLVARAAGVLRTDRDDDHALRLLALRDQLREVLARHPADVAVVESVFFSSNVRTAISVGQASGVLIATAAEAGLPVVYYTPLEVKQAVTGVGTAGKAQVQAMVRALLGLAELPRPADAADACALAICHVNRSGLRAAVARAGSG